LAAKFKAKILPLPAKADDDQAWVERLLLVASHLDEAGLNGLDRLTGLVGFAR
jgi:sister-chromatid-cohesion protein PDS5